MKKRVAIVRGPNLNSWEMQNFTPLMETFDFVGFTSHGHNFDVSQIPFEVRKLFSMGQFLRARLLRNLLVNTIGDYHDLQGLGRALKEFDIVHCAETSYYCTYQAARAKKTHPFKLVITVWENIPFLQNNPATAKNKQTIFDNTDLFLPVTERAKEALLLEGAPASKTIVQMPGIDIHHFRPLSKDKQLLEEFGCGKFDQIVLFVANLYREKGVFDLLYAFRKMLNSKPSRPLKLLIAGKGREEQEVRTTISELSLQDNVRLIGSFSYAMMPRIHNLADVLVLPSIPIRTWQEQFGYVLIESMACGKPVVSTLSGSISEVVGSAGILVQPNDFVALANGMESILGDERTRQKLGSVARKRVEEVFALSIVSEQFEQHYSSLTK